MHQLCHNRDRPKVQDVGPLIEAYYQLPDNIAGGICHVVLDDCNVEDEFVRSTLADCETSGDVLGAQIMRAMLSMTRTQRLKLMKYTDSGIKKRFEDISKKNDSA